MRTLRRVPLEPVPGRKDSIGWHSDREEEISQVTPIATVSLGAERRFRLRTRMSRTQSFWMGL
jgi:alkylated DNA repair dioxygenase AlkB